MTARLDDSGRTVNGTASITWRNHSDVAVDVIPFHLYLNGFRSGSTYWSESGEREIDGEYQGAIEITKFSSGGRDLLPGMRFISPDDGNADDRTLVEVALGRTVPPGGSIRLEIAFVSKFPRVSARTGWSESFLFAGQWYPKPAVLEPAGVRGRDRAGFNRHQFHYDSEFYGEFADFDVTIETPSDWIVGATGAQALNQVEGTRRTTRWIARNVHDFAWSASPDFVERVFRFDPQRDVAGDWRTEAARLLGVEPASLRLEPVEVRLLMQPHNVRLIERYRDATFGTLAWAGLRLGSYPWRRLTIVDPPEDALDAGGMEYPMLVTAMTHPTLAMWPFSAMTRWPEVVVSHEVAHQWFYGMVASNEFEESWIDEGLTSWIEMEVMDELYPSGFASSGFSPPMSMRAMNRLSFLAQEPENVDPIVRHSWGYAPGGYAYNSYQRPALAVMQISGIIGERDFARAMRAFTDRYSFRHPGTADFFSTVEEISGEDLSEIRDGVFHADASFDHLIHGVRSAREGDEWSSRVTIARQGELAIPTTVRLYYGDGATRDLRFPGDARLLRWNVRSLSPLERVVIDPERVNLLESDASNNVRILGSRGPWPRAASLQAVALVSRVVRLVVAGW